MKLIFLDGFEQRSLSCLILNFFADHYHNSHDIGKMQTMIGFSNYEQEHCVNGTESLDFVISNRMKIFRCINDLMLIFRNPCRCFLINFRNFLLCNFKNCTLA